MIRRTLRAFLYGPEPDDILVGDLVRIGGRGRVGTVHEINGDTAIVAWDGDHRSIQPLNVLRRIPQRGQQYDRRRGE